MKFEIDNLPILFPYPYIYPEQYEYMHSLKQTLDARGHALLEMPSGTGKTITLLALVVAYIQYYPERKLKLIYCSRTVPEIEKTLKELKNLMKYREQELNKEETFLGIGLTSRKNFCIHPEISQDKNGKRVDARCQGVTASWVREKAKTDHSVELCQYFESLDIEGQELSIPNGIYTIEELKDYGKEHTQCPYFLARRMLQFANVIIYSYHYLIDPKVADMVSKELSKDCIVVFDEAHNIDNVCIESLSIDIGRYTLDASTRSINVLQDKLEDIKTNDIDRLRTEYQTLVERLHDNRLNRQTDVVMSNPILPDDILQEAVPGNIRKAEHFVAFLRRFVEYLKTVLRALQVTSEVPLSFLAKLKEATMIERKPLRFCAERLASLVKTLELHNVDDLSALHRVASFATLVSTYTKGFMLIMEPFETSTSTVPNPVLHFCCLDASIAIKPVFDRFQSVVITSGTLSPLDMYPKMLNLRTVTERSFPMTLARSCFLPLVITRGADQVAISSKFEVRNDPAVVRNFGNILIDMAKCIPDGIACFFPSYIYMESIVSMWNDMNIIDEVLKYKLVFIETPDAAETTIALENYRAACDNGRGAVLISVARGKVSEGIDFDHNYGRAVIMFGIPYQYTESRILKARLEYLRENFRIKENDFLTFDALRHAAQCMGRVIRGKTDYGLMIFADKRYARADKRSKLPAWINAGITEASVNVSTDMAVSLTKRFLRTMAQPFEFSEQLGTSVWGKEHIGARMLKRKTLHDTEEGREGEVVGS